MVLVSQKHTNTLCTIEATPSISTLKYNFHISRSDKFSLKPTSGQQQKSSANGSRSRNHHSISNHPICLGLSREGSGSSRRAGTVPDEIDAGCLLFGAQGGANAGEGERGGAGGAGCVGIPTPFPRIMEVDVSLMISSCYHVPNQNSDL